MHERIDTTTARPATTAYVDRPGVPSITSLIAVSPSRQSRSLGDRIRTLIGDDPARLIGRAGIGVATEFGIPGVVAIGWKLVQHRFKSEDRQMLESLRLDDVFASDDLSADCFDPEIVPTPRFVWDRRALALASIGYVILDGVVTGPDWSLSDRNAAHRWAEELECILRVRAIDEDDDSLIDDDDHLLLDQAADLAVLGGFSLTDLSALLRYAFDLAGRSRPIVLPADFGIDTVCHVWTQSSLFDVFADLAPEHDMPLPFRPRHDRPRPLRSSPAPRVVIPGIFD
jgi:hypothetical protein